MSHSELSDLSEDGELKKSPIMINADDDNFSFDEGDTADSLDIKPPQAKLQTKRAHHKHERKTRESRSKHDKYKHDHEKRQRGKVDAQMYRRRSDDQRFVSTRYDYEKAHKSEADKRVVKYVDDKVRRDSAKRKEDAHGLGAPMGDQALLDLRDRLLDKKRLKEAHDGHKNVKHKRSSKYAELTDEFDASKNKDDAHVEHERKERKHHKRSHKHSRHKTNANAQIDLTQDAGVVDDDDDDDKDEQNVRKKRLLEAAREMSRMKQDYYERREKRESRVAYDSDEKKRGHDELERKRRRLEEKFGQAKALTNEIMDEIVINSDESDVEMVTDDDAEVEKKKDGSSESEESKSEEESDESSSSSNNTTGQNTATDDERKSSNRSNTRSRSPLVRRRSVTRSRSQSYSQSPEPNSRKTSQSPKRFSRSKSRTPTKEVASDAKESTETKEPTEEPVVEEEEEIEELPPYIPGIQGCRSVEEFQCLNRIEEGTYGVVYRAKDKRTQEIVALKRLKIEKEREGFPITSLREINTLLKGQHPNIVTVREIVVGSDMDKIFIVMDYVEHDLKSLMETMRHKKQGFIPGEIKCLLKQLLTAVAHLHDNWILHRDLKTSNLLLSHKGILKVGDFGLAREYGSPLKAYTPIVVTLWYRAPELLLCAKEYSTPIDVWSVGCIFAEFCLMHALFPGKSDADQLNRIFKELGTPNERIWPGYNELPAVKKMSFAEYPIANLKSKFRSLLSDLGINLLERFLTYDPTKRVTAEQALTHAYFSETPLPIDPAMFPTWPAKSELGHRRALAASPKPPSGGGQFKKLEGDDDAAFRFHMGATVVDQRRLPAVGAGFSLKF